MPCVWVALAMGAIGAGFSSGLIPGTGPYFHLAIWMQSVLGSVGALMFPGAIAPVREAILKFSTGDKYKTVPPPLPPEKK
jgi:hypothetical protein